METNGSMTAEDVVITALKASAGPAWFGGDNVVMVLVEYLND